MRFRPVPAARLFAPAALWRPALLLAVMAGGQFALQCAGIDPAGSLAALAHCRGGIAELLFLPAGAALCCLGVPRQLLGFAAGAGFGPWLGALLAVAATTLGCAATFAWARLAARDWVQQRIRGRLARADRFLAAHPFSATLMLRLLPVGNNLLLNLVAGVSAVAAGRFLLGSAVGYVPQGLVFAVLGAGTRVGAPALLAVGAALFVASSAIGVWLLGRAWAGYGPGLAGFAASGAGDVPAGEAA
jgi:uncharacterized membrane protein YdjX (TVP38/TMEM64 family)